MRLSTILHNRFLVSIFACLFFAQYTFAGVFDSGDATKGETLFKQNCASCHSVDGSLLAAPSLQGVDARWAGKDALIVKWIQNPNGALGTGDPYIVGMVAKWKGQFGMMAAQAVSEAEIADILAYVKTGGSAGGAASAAQGPKCMTLEEIEAAKAELEGDDNAYIWFIIIGLILAIIAVSAANISRSLQVAVNERDGLPIPAERSYLQVAKAWMWNNKKFVSIVGFIIFCYISVVGYKSLMGIGIYEGYTPDQPIWFSHAVHACQNEIDCQYCHSSAAKSKHAGIPSLNVCMNCHKGIKKGAISGTTEIAKIYEHIGWNPDSAKYIGPQVPLAWNKVHNLPDHVYFSHQQHVTVGQIDCKQCHGPVQMYTVGHIATPEEINAQEDVNGLIKLEKQTLTMGWCLECHNKSGIDPTKSEYYEEMHKRYKANEVGKRTLADIMEDGTMTVRENGGWECGKCHY